MSLVLHTRSCTFANLCGCDRAVGTGDRAVGTGDRAVGTWKPGFLRNMSPVNAMPNLRQMMTKIQK